VVAASVFDFAAAVPLTIYTGVLSARLRLLGITRGAATVALAAGTLAAAATVFSALVTWVISRPEVREQATLVGALHDLSFVSGGVAFAVFLGVMIAPMAAAGRGTGVLTRPVGLLGLALGGLAMVSSLGLVWSPFFYLLPIGRFGGLIWLTYVGFRLPHSRPRRTAPAPSPAHND